MVGFKPIAVRDAGLLSADSVEKFGFPQTLEYLWAKTPVFSWLHEIRGLNLLTNVLILISEAYFSAVEFYDDSSQQNRLKAAS